MKNLVLMAAVFSGLISTGPTRVIADETMLRPVSIALRAEIMRFEIDPDLNYADNIESGSIEVNYAKKTAELVLYRKSMCRPDMICIALVPPPMIIQLPIISVNKDGCGSKVIIAKKDMRPVDGALNELEIMDNSHRICRDLRAPTEITHLSSFFNRINGFTETNESHFYANRLELVEVPFSR